MSICSNLTELDLTSLPVSAEKQENQRAIKIENRNLKQTHDIKLAESLSLITKKLDNIDYTTKKLRENVKTAVVKDENTQTPTLQKIIGTQSSRDTLTLMKRSKNFLKSVEKDNGDVFGNSIFFKPIRENRFTIKDEEYNINPKIQACFTDTKLTTKPRDKEDKLSIFKIVEKTQFYSMTHNKGLN